MALESESCWTMFFDGLGIPRIEWFEVTDASARLLIMKMAVSQSLVTPSAESLTPPIGD